jgi:hypothetical protein
VIISTNSISFCVEYEAIGLWRGIGEAYYSLLALGENIHGRPCIWFRMRAQKAKEQNHFSHEISFELVEITFFRPNFCEKSPKKNHRCLLLDKDPMWGAFPK